MFQNLDVFSAASMMARHSAARQSVISENVANANTPGYRAQDIKPFELGARSHVSTTKMMQTRDGHQTSIGFSRHELEFVDDALATSPDGNSVSVENEILKSVEAERQHSRAMTIYQSSLNLIRTSIGRGR